MKRQDAIEWEELLQLLTRFTNSKLVREVTIKHNQLARAMDRTPEEHVDLDIFVYYFNDAPSSEVQMEIAKGFIGDNGPRKVWDGLNIAAACNNPSIRLYNCLLFWPPEKDHISQAEGFQKIGFTINGRPGVRGYVNSYTFRRSSQESERGETISRNGHNLSLAGGTRGVMETYGEFTIRRFGVLSVGTHTPESGKACATEAYHAWLGEEWSHDPRGMIPNLRPLNDGLWISDEARTRALIFSGNSSVASRSSGVSAPVR